jgi:hypothetical protein
MTMEFGSKDALALLSVSGAGFTFTLNASREA